MQVIERILHMLRVKDCRHVCLFCEYYDMCKQRFHVTGNKRITGGTEKNENYCSYVTERWNRKDNDIGCKYLSKV